MSRIGRGPGAARRWGSVLGGTLLLAAIPAAAGRLPVHAPEMATDELLARARASDTVAYQGYAESTGRIAVPEVRQFERVLELLSSTSKFRVWWRTPTDWRVDSLTPIGERGLYRDGLGTVVWDSFERRATRINGEPEVRLPRSADLLPPELGRRLAAAIRPGVDRVDRIAARRVAGRAVPGLRVTPQDVDSTIAHVDLWIEAASGLPVAAEITAKGATKPTIATRFLELTLDRPPAARTEFVVPRDAEYDTQAAPDLLANVDGFSPFLLPAIADGRARRGGSRSTATYGEGFGLVAAAVVPDWMARRVYRALEGSPALDLPGGVRALTTPLLNGIVVRNTGQGVGLVVSGAVSVEALERAAVALAANLTVAADG